MSLATLGLVSPAVMRAHRATWWVYAGPEKIRHTASMRGQWGYDVTCSCGAFATRTGGGTRAYVQGQLDDHRLTASRCATIGHTRRPATHVVSYRYRGDTEVDTEFVCAPCAESYGRRPVLADFTARAL